MSRFILALFLITASLNALAQLLLKYGAPHAAEQFFSTQNPLLKVLKVIFNPYIFLAVTILAGGMFLWIYLISRLDLSQAYPVNIALTILITSIAAVFLFSEQLTVFRIIGVLFVIMGIWFLLRP